MKYMDLRGLTTANLFEKGLERDRLLLCFLIIIPRPAVVNGADLNGAAGGIGDTEGVNFV